MTIDYGTHGMPDIGANEMFYNATRRGGIETKTAEGLPGRKGAIRVQ